LALVVVFASNPNAVAAVDVDATQNAIAKTDRLMAHTRELLIELESDRGEQALAGAEYLQRDAREALDRGDLATAHRLTIEARERALQAVGDSRSPRRRGAQRVENELRATDRFLENLKGRMRPHRKGPPQGRPQRWAIGGIKKRQAQAWEYYRRGEFRPALRETLAVRERLESLKGFRGGGGPKSRRDHRGRLDMEIVRIGSFIARAEEMIGNRHRSAAKHLQDATAAHQAAHRALTEGNPRSAQRHVRESHEALREVLNGIAESLEAGEFEQLSGDARDRWNEITETASPDDSLRIRGLLRRTDGILDRAEQSFYEGDKKTALRHLFHALNMMDQPGKSARR
jgi:hypothetical protein